MKRAYIPVYPRSQVRYADAFCAFARLIRSSYATGLLAQVRMLIKPITDAFMRRRATNQAQVRNGPTGPSTHDRKDDKRST